MVLHLVLVIELIEKLKMNRLLRISLFGIFILVSNSTYSQRARYFAHSMIIGTSATYIWDSDEFNNYQNELTWNTNVGITLSKRFFSGIQLLNIYTWGTIEPKESYYIYGLFTQYNFFKSTDHRLFAEISINNGDYNCFLNNNPIRESNLFYLGTGFGYDLPIRFIPRLYFDFSFIGYNVLNHFNFDFEYTQYILGLNYRINEKRY